MHKCIFCNKLTNDSEKDHWCKEKKKAYADLEPAVEKKPAEKPSHNPPQSNDTVQNEKQGNDTSAGENVREKERQTLQDWRERNRDHYNETMRQWREDNREAYREYMREYMRRRRKARQE